VEQIARELRSDAAHALVLHRVVQVHDAQPVTGGRLAQNPIARDRLALTGQEVEARQVGHDRVLRQPAEQLVELRREAVRVPAGDVVRADRDRHDRVGDERGLDAREAGQLLLERRLERRARDTEIDDTDAAPRQLLEPLCDDADVAARGPRRPDALRRRVADRDVEDVAGQLAPRAPVGAVHGDVVGEDALPRDLPAHQPAVPGVAAAERGGGHTDGEKGLRAPAHAT